MKVCKMTAVIFNIYTIVSSFYNTDHSEQYKDKSYRKKQLCTPSFKEPEPTKKFKILTVPVKLK